jgi:transposase
MHVVYERCAGLDVHKKNVVACVILTFREKVEQMVQTFQTTTAGLLALFAWLKSLQVTHIAMESTGIYWRPIFNVLEEGHTIILVNAQHMKAIPGRKTDVKDSEWLADLLRHGLLKASFIPPKAIRELRELVRYRKGLVAQRTQEINRLHKVLETANIKLASVASNVVGKSGRAMIRALIAGEQNLETVTQMAHGALRQKMPQLREALQGHLEDHHRFLLEQLLNHIEYLERTTTTICQQIQERSVPLQQSIDLLMSIPGVQWLAAVSILAEIGTDMSCFPSAKHLASWAGVCPGNKQSAGKRLSGKTTQGNPYLKAVLTEVIWGISRTRDNYLSAQFHRLSKRLGQPKAIVAMEHSVLTIIFHMLRDKKAYHDLGADYFKTMDRERLAQQSVKRLQALGYAVTLIPAQEVMA